MHAAVQRGLGALLDTPAHPQLVLLDLAKLACPEGHAPTEAGVEVLVLACHLVSTRIEDTLRADELDPCSLRGLEVVAINARGARTRLEHVEVMQ